MKRGHRELERVTGGYRRLQLATGSYRRLHEVTESLSYNTLMGAQP